MKSDTSSKPAPRKSAFDWLLMAILIIGAAGMGVTGTLLWMQNQQKTPATANPQASTTTNTSNAPGMAIPRGSAGSASSAPAAEPLHEPPASLTAGMPPAQAALTVGNWYYDHRAWPQSILNYQRAIAQGMDNPDIRTDLGSALRFSGQPRQALEQYRLAQKQNPRHENSLFNQGGVYASDLKQPAKAVAIWREYLKRFPAGQSVAQARQLIAKTQSQPNPSSKR